MSLRRCLYSPTRHEEDASVASDTAYQPLLELDIITCACAGPGGRAHIRGGARHPGGPGEAGLQRSAAVVRAAPRAPAQDSQQAGVQAAHPGGHSP